MKEQEAIQTYGEEMPQMPEKTIPIRGGLQALKETDPEKLKNPLPSDPLCIQRGKEGYANYCIMCHGLKGEGNGTVGQSFHPFPQTFGALPVQRKSDGKTLLHPYLWLRTPSVFRFYVDGRGPLGNHPLHPISQ